MDVFRSSMQRKMIKESDPFDWEKENSEEDASVNALATTLAVAGLTTRADIHNQNNTTQPIPSSTKPLAMPPVTTVTTQLQPTTAGMAIAPATVAQQQQYPPTPSTTNKEIELNNNNTNNVVLDYSNRNDSNYGNESLKKQHTASLAQQQQQKSSAADKAALSQQQQVPKRSSTVDQQRLSTAAADNSQSLQSLRKARVPIDTNANGSSSKQNGSYIAMSNYYFIFIKIRQVIIDFSNLTDFILNIKIL